MSSIRLPASFDRLLGERQISAIAGDLRTEVTGNAILRWAEVRIELGCIAPGKLVGIAPDFFSDRIRTLVRALEAWGR